jgi:hypothetical protein
VSMRYHAVNTPPKKCNTEWNTFNRSKNNVKPRRSDDRSSAIASAERMRAARREEVAVERSDDEAEELRPAVTFASCTNMMHA